MKTTILLFVLHMVLNSSSSVAQPGTLDSTFSKVGKVFTSIGDLNDGANAVAIQKDGKILAAGFSQDSSVKSKFVFAFALVRYLTHGRVDSSFGTNGIVTTYFRDKSSVANAIAIQNDGKIIVAGYSVYSKKTKYNSFFAIARYMPDGSLDVSFGLKGKVITDIDSNEDRANAIAIQPDGKIVVAGYTLNYNNSGFPVDIAVVRYQSNGTPDSSFGINGKVITDFLGYEGFHNNDYGNTIAVLPNGKIIIGGHSDPMYGNMSFILVRYKSNGAVDSSFGKNGSTFNSLHSGSAGSSLAILSNGKILLGGYTQSIATGFTLIQYKKDGTLDSSFGNNGVAFPSYYSGYGKSIAVQKNGKIIVAGFATGIDTTTKLMRFTSRGRLDSSFGANGIVFTDLQSKYDYYWRIPAPAIALQKDGKIVVATNGKNKFAIARYNGDSVTEHRPSDDILSKQISTNTFSPYISPNPVKNILHLQNLSSSIKAISIFNLNGKVLQQVVTTNNSYSFKVNQIPAGIYFVSIKEGEKNRVLKFIKE